MSTLIPYNEPPIPRLALEIERLRQRLDTAEAALRARPAAPAAGLGGARALTALSFVAAAALVVIAGSLVWQQVSPRPPGQPTIVVQAPAAPVPQPQMQASAQSGAQAGNQGNATLPGLRPNIVLPPPNRPGMRW